MTKEKNTQSSYNSVLHEIVDDVMNNMCAAHPYTEFKEEAKRVVDLLSLNVDIDHVDREQLLNQTKECYGKLFTVVESLKYSYPEGLPAFVGGDNFIKSVVIFVKNILTETNLLQYMVLNNEETNLNNFENTDAIKLVIAHACLEEFSNILGDLIRHE